MNDEIFFVGVNDWTEEGQIKTYYEYDEHGNIIAIKVGGDRGLKIVKKALKENGIHIE